MNSKSQGTSDVEGNLSVFSATSPCDDELMMSLLQPRPNTVPHSKSSHWHCGKEDAACVRVAFASCSPLHSTWRALIHVVNGVMWLRWHEFEVETIRIPTPLFIEATAAATSVLGRSARHDPVALWRGEGEASMMWARRLLFHSGTSASVIIIKPCGRCDRMMDAVPTPAPNKEALFPRRCRRCRWPCASRSSITLSVGDITLPNALNLPISAFLPVTANHTLAADDKFWESATV